MEQQRNDIRGSDAHIRLNPLPECVTPPFLVCDCIETLLTEAEIQGSEISWIYRIPPVTALLPCFQSYPAFMLVESSHTLIALLRRLELRGQFRALSSKVRLAHLSPEEGQVFAANTVIKSLRKSGAVHILQLETRAYLDGELYFTNDWQGVLIDAAPKDSYPEELAGDSNLAFVTPVDQTQGAADRLAFAINLSAHRSVTKAHFPGDPIYPGILLVCAMFEGLRQSPWAHEAAQWSTQALEVLSNFKQELRPGMESLTLHLIKNSVDIRLSAEFTNGRGLVAQINLSPEPSPDL